MSKRARMIGLVSAVCLMAFTGVVRAAVVFSENFDGYADNTAFQTAWNVASGGSVTTSYTPAMRPNTLTVTNPSTSGTTNGPLVTLSSKAASLNNAYGYRDLSTPVNSDFTLTFKMASTSYQRFNGIALTDSTGSNGYFFAWSGANTNSFSGAGYFNLYKVTSPITAWNLPGETTQVGSQILNVDATQPAASQVPYAWVTGVPITSNDSPDGTFNNGTSFTWGDAPADPLATITISWMKSTGQFTFTSNGHMLVFSALDTTYSNFSRIYLTGNTNGVYDDISIAVPEPVMGSVAPLLIGGVALRRRRRPSVI